MQEQNQNAQRNLAEYAEEGQIKCQCCSRQGLVHDGARRPASVRWPCHSFADSSYDQYGHFSTTCGC